MPVPTRRRRAALPVAALVAAAFLTAPLAGLLAAPAAAAVTRDSCPGGRTAHPHDFGDQVGEDYNDLYEQLIAKSPPSKVSVASSWTCTDFQRVDGVDLLAFTSGLRADGGLGGSTPTALGCGQLFVTDLDTGARFDVHDAAALDDRGDEVVCIWEEIAAALTPGHSFLFEVSESLTYDWKAPGHDATYRFRARLDVHAEVSQPGGNPHDHPVCYRAVPQVGCDAVPV